MNEKKICLYVARELSTRKPFMATNYNTKFQWLMDCHTVASVLEATYPDFNRNEFLKECDK
jgi:hypothetical protein